MAQKKNNSNKIGVSVGLGMLVAGIAGAYYLYGTKEGTKKRAKIKGWTLKAKGEVLEKLENLKDVNEVKYNEVLEMVMKKYRGLKNIDRGEIDALVVDLKKHWKNITRHIKSEVKTGVKKTVKKAKKKTT